MRGPAFQATYSMTKSAADFKFQRILHDLLSCIIIMVIRARVGPKWDSNTAIFDKLVRRNIIIHPYRSFLNTRTVAVKERPQRI